MGGWTSRRPPIASPASASAAAAHLGDVIDARACTINEPNIVVDDRLPRGRVPARAAATIGRCDARSTTSSSTPTTRRSTPSSGQRARRAGRASRCRCSDYQARRRRRGATSATQIRRRHGGRVPRGHRGRRLHRRADLLAANGSAPSGALGNEEGVEPTLDGLRVLARVARGHDPPGVGGHERRHADARHRERHRHRRRRPTRRVRASRPARACSRASPTASTCAATRTGACSTTSSGPSATGPASGSSASTARPRSARPSRARRWLGAVARANAMDI